MENVPNGEGYADWRRLHHGYDPWLTGRRARMLLDIMNHVFPEGHQLQIVIEVYEKKCGLHKGTPGRGCI